MEEGPSIPIFNGPEGILFDFNYGCRVQVPVSGWRVKMFDSDTFNVLLNEQVEANVVIASMRKYYVRFLLEVFDGPRLVFSHTFNPTTKKIRLHMPPWALEYFEQEAHVIFAHAGNDDIACPWANTFSRCIGTAIHICILQPKRN